MGREVDCIGRIRGQAAEGRALLETTEIIFRGEARAKLPLKDVKKVSVKGDTLRLELSDKSVWELELGAQNAAAWAKAIQNPKGRLDKLGIKPGQRVSLLGVDDASIEKEIRERTEDVTLGKAAKDSDHLFIAIDSAKDLNRLSKLKASLKDDGALWVIRRKGKDAPVSEAATMAAGKAAGLVDVKVVSFSDTHTAEKYVIPVAARKARG